MNVYDFDHTIYDGDCTLDFYFFCIKRHSKVLLSLPNSVKYMILYMMHACSREKFKEVFYSFLAYVPEIDREIEKFWDKNERKIKKFYLEQSKEDDLIISASPEFLIENICCRLEVCYIASKVDKNDGKLLGPNCRGEEKVKEFKKRYPEGKIEKFYSDSYSDIFLARISDAAFKVSGNKIVKMIT